MTLEASNGLQEAHDGGLYKAWEKLCTFKGNVNNVPGRNPLNEMLRQLVPDYDYKAEYRQLIDKILKDPTAVSFFGDRATQRRMKVENKFWDNCLVQNGIATFYRNGQLQGACNLAPENIRLTLQRANDTPEEDSDDPFADVNKVVSKMVYRKGMDPLAMVLEALNVSDSRAEYLKKVILQKGSAAARWFDKDHTPTGSGESKPGWKDGMIMTLNHGHVTIQDSQGFEVGAFNLITNEALGIAKERHDGAVTTAVNNATLGDRELRKEIMRNGKLKKGVVNLDEHPAVYYGKKESKNFPLVDGKYTLGSKDFDAKIPQSGANFYKEFGSSKITIEASHKEHKNTDAVIQEKRDAVWDSSDGCYKYTDGKKEKVTFWNNYYYEIGTEATYSGGSYTPRSTPESKGAPKLTNDDLLPD